MAVWRQPHTPFAYAIVNFLFPSIVPTPDFPAYKCLALRQAFVPRLERIEETNCHTVAAIRAAVLHECSEARDQRDHPLHSGTTDFVRYLNAYAIQVEAHGGRLVEPDDEVYMDFADHVDRVMAGGQGSEDDGSESDARSSDDAPT